MKRPYKQALAEGFQERLRVLDPGYVFEPKTIDREGLHSGLYFVKRLNEADLLFLLVRPSPKGRNQFDLAYGWSRRGEIPTEPSAYADDFPRNLSWPEARFVLMPWIQDFMWTIEDPYSWETKPKRVSIEEAKAKVVPAIEACFAEFLRVAYPILQAADRELSSRRS